MKKHKSMKMKDQPMPPAQGEDDENMEPDGMTPGMKRGGKAKAKKYKKGGKVEGEKMKMRLDKPMKKATGGPVSKPMNLDTTDSGISPSAPFAKDAPQHKKGGKVR